MKLVKKIFDDSRRHFTGGGKLASLHPLFEAMETLFFIPANVAAGTPHVRDSLDLKRFMSLVLVALIPPFLFGIYNTGYQAHLFGGRPLDFIPVVMTGLTAVLPIVAVSYGVGLFWELLFASVRKHNISEGFLVTGLLFPLTLPPTVPLWQVAVGISFGVVIGKEIFGGTGRNILNPALTARAFMFFAFPGKMSGDAVWVAAARGKEAAVDAVTAATPLAVSATISAGESTGVALEKAGYTFSNIFMGFIPGSIGETSALMSIIGAGLLILLGIANYRIIAGGVIGMLAVSWPGYIIGMFSDLSAFPLFTLHPLQNLAMGGFAFGIAYMATDPVTGPGTNRARWVYGFFIGALTALIRGFNPAYTEGVMLAILFMNLFSPLLDHIVIKTALRKRVPNV